MPNYPVATLGPFPFFLRAFRYRNYRLFFGGQVVSQVGTWMTQTATAWLVYRLTGSAILLGVVGFAGQLPAFLLAPVAGVYADRWDRRRLLLVTQILSMVQSALLALLTLGGWITVGHLIGLSALQGMIVAFEMPCRQAMVVSMIEKREDLGNAIALNSSLVNVARLLGPSLAGIVIAAAGEGWCFAIDAVSFLAVIGAIVALRLPPRAESPRGAVGTLPLLWEGLRYTFGFRPMRSIIGLLALVSLLGFPYTVLMPIMAGKVLHGGPHTLGFLMGASGLGALAGAVWLAGRKSVLGLGRVIPLATIAFGFGLAAFSFSRNVWLSAGLMVVAGFGFVTQLAAGNTILQTLVDEEKRGRVMSIFMMAFLGTAPLGCLLAGNLAERIGAPRTILLGGLGCVAGGLWFLRDLPALRRAIRPVYERMGILPLK